LIAAGPLGDDHSGGSLDDWRSAPRNLAPLEQRPWMHHELRYPVDVHFACNCCDGYSNLRAMMAIFLS